jgi:hypothetical protein
LESYLLSSPSNDLSKSSCLPPTNNSALSFAVFVLTTTEVDEKALLGEDPAGKVPGDATSTSLGVDTSPNGEIGSAAPAMEAMSAL